LQEHKLKLKDLEEEKKRAEVTQAKMLARETDLAEEAARWKTSTAALEDDKRHDRCLLSPPCFPLSYLLFSSSLCLSLFPLTEN
jgi:hypothetical protein